VLGGGTVLSGMAFGLLELCEVVGRAGCGVKMVSDRRSDWPGLYADWQLRLFLQSGGCVFSNVPCVYRVCSRDGTAGVYVTSRCFRGALSVSMMMGAPRRLTVGEDLTSVRLPWRGQPSGRARASTWSSWLSSGAAGILFAQKRHVGGRTRSVAHRRPHSYT
jgi:hypothetical protein